MRRLGGGGREERGYDISLGAEFDWQTGVQRGGGRGEGRGPSLTGSLLANCSAEFVSDKKLCYSSFKKKILLGGCY